MVDELSNMHAGVKRSRGTVERMHIPKGGWIQAEDSGAVFAFSFTNLPIDTMAVLEVGSYVEFTASRTSNSLVARDISTRSARNKHKNLVGELLSFDTKTGTGFVSYGGETAYFFKGGSGLQDLPSSGSTKVLFDRRVDHSTTAIHATNVRSFYSAAASSGAVPRKTALSRLKAPEWQLVTNRQRPKDYLQQEAGLGSPAAA